MNSEGGPGGVESLPQEDFEFYANLMSKNEIPPKTQIPCSPQDLYKSLPDKNVWIQHCEKLKGLNHPQTNK